MHIVVFPGWYPNRLDKLSGDFIQRHMYAISLHCHVSVIIPVKDNSVKKVDTITITHGNLTELYYYYPAFSKIKWLEKTLSFVRYNLGAIYFFQTVAKTKNVDVVHLYVLQKNQLLGLLLHWFCKIPYFISEQSTLYVDGRLEKLGRFQKKLLSYVFKAATSYHAVSDFLACNIQQKLGLGQKAVIIPNVVDTSVFFQVDKLPGEKTIFIHVSNMVAQKNVEGILQALHEVKKVNRNFLLKLIGPLTTSVTSAIDTLYLTDNVEILKQQNYTAVAKFIQQSDAFILFSRFETFGCVIIEANACGIPVIVSDLQVTRELVTENENGLFVESENVKDLAEKIIFLIENPSSFNSFLISLKAKNTYNYDLVGKMFSDWYAQALNKNK